MVALVTGGAGFIGSNIAEELKDPIILDDLSTANDYSIAFIKGLGVEFIEGSVTDKELLKEILPSVDTVYHQAAVPSVPRSVKDPQRSNRANVGGSLTLLVEAVSAGVKDIVYASSSSVYGDTPTLPKVETMQPNPKSPYAISKLAPEHYMRVFSELYGINAACLRYFNVFGPRQNPDSEYSAVIPKFAKAAFLGEELTIYGDGKQSRDFTYVKDVVRANKLAAGKNGIFNIAGGRATELSKLAEMILELASSNSKTVHLDERPGDIKHSLADISKAKKELSWEPEYSLKEGLKEYIPYFEKNLVK